METLKDDPNMIAAEPRQGILIEAFEWRAGNSDMAGSHPFQPGDDH
jgi:hypothetical protein